MTPSERCKRAGLSGLKELVQITEQSEQTLINWASKKSILFDVLVKGAAATKIESEKRIEPKSKIRTLVEQLLEEVEAKTGERL
ncbi:MAG: hypothetical protein CMI09_09325 [Oceanospirillaceae bacterium]|nr:hypothetical protein [Oceanospirillaceae bacterium]|tara:strand:- start:793 stop:1044 length:252 start_codon:yes stop_codon:yes gene_type:complete